MNGSEAAALGVAPIPGDRPQDALSMPLISMTKEMIENRAEFFLNDFLEVYSASDLWVMMKQVEYATEVIKAKLQTVAFDQIARELGGSMKGEILGHVVQLTLPSKWIYPDDVTDLQEQQKRDLKAAKAKAEADGTAFKESTEQGQIRVTIRGSK